MPASLKLYQVCQWDLGYSENDILDLDLKVRGKRGSNAEKYNGEESECPIDSGAMFLVAARTPKDCIGDLL